MPPSLEPSSSKAREPASSRSSPSPRSTVSARFRPRTARVSTPPFKLTVADSTSVETLIVAGVELPSSSRICVLARKTLPTVSGSLASASSSIGPMSIRPTSRASVPLTTTVSVPPVPASMMFTVPPRTPAVSMRYVSPPLRPVTFALPRQASTPVWSMPLTRTVPVALPIRNVFASPAKPAASVARSNTEMSSAVALTKLPFDSWRDRSPAGCRSSGKRHGKLSMISSVPPASTNVSVPPMPETRSLPRPGVDVVVGRRADDLVVAVAADQVDPAPLDRGDHARGVDEVVAAQRVDAQAVARHARVVDGERVVVRPRHRGRPGGARDEVDGVVAVGELLGHLVGAGAGGDRRRQHADAVERADEQERVGGGVARDAQALDAVPVNELDDRVAEQLADDQLAADRPRRGSSPGRRCR